MLRRSRGRPGRARQRVDPLPVRLSAHRVRGAAPRCTETRNVTSASPLGSSTHHGLAGQPAHQAHLVDGDLVVAVVLRLLLLCLGHITSCDQDSARTTDTRDRARATPCGRQREESVLWTTGGRERRARTVASRKCRRGHPKVTPLPQCMSGGVLLSHNLSVAVPSALKGLTSGFGMGPGVSRFAMAAVTLSTTTHSPHPGHRCVGGWVCWLGTA